MLNSTPLDFEPAYNVLNALAAPYRDLDNAEELRLEIRPRWDKGQTSKGFINRRWFAITPRGCFEAAQFGVTAGERMGVYLSLLPRLGEFGTTEAVPYAACLWASVDGNDAGPLGAGGHLAAALKEASLPSPHIAIGSGNGLHCAWMLAEPVNMTAPNARERHAGAIRRLALAVGGTYPAPAAETNAAYAAYMIRLPESHNHKAAYTEAGGPRRVRLIRFAPDAPRQNLTWWRAYLPAEPAPPRQYDRPNPDWKPGKTTQIPEDILALARSGVSDGSRHDTAKRMTARLYARGFRADVALPLLQSFAAASGWRTDRNYFNRLISTFERRHA